jgi:hypothetical protein
LSRAVKRPSVVTAFLLLTASAFAAPADAQDRQWSERMWVSVNGGVQTGGSGFDDTFEKPLYTETERVTVEYPVKQGGLFAAQGGYRVWKRLTVGVGVTRYSKRKAAQVEARLPHPFFDNQFREVAGTTSALRGETDAHLLFGWMQPIGNHLRAIVTAGPAFVNVEQTIATDVEFAEVYPYDTAEFTGASTRRATRRGTGFNVGADVTWMFTRRLGAGALVQFTRARPRLNAGANRTIAVDAGGVQAGAGVRLFF